jgi:hypothetical protein
MKQKLLLLCCLFTVTGFTGFAQFRLSTGYNLSLGLQEMGKHLSPVHGLYVSGMMPLKGINKRLQLGLETGYGIYANINRKETYQFIDGSTTRANVNFSSSTVGVNSLLRYSFKEKKGIAPYVSVRGGYHYFFTSVYVDDPSSLDDCVALEKDNIFSDHTFSAAVGTGLQIDLGRIVRPINYGKYYIDLGAHYVRGGTISFLNVNHMHDHAPTPVAGDKDPNAYYLKFINVTSQRIHEHKVAEIHTTPLRMLDIRLSFLVRLGDR